MGSVSHSVDAPSSTAAGSAATSGDRLAGTVVEWSERGFGFIVFSDGRRAYVHHSSIGGGQMLQGEPVSAVLVEDNQNAGKWAAIDVRRQGEPVNGTGVSDGIQARSPSAASHSKPQRVLSLLAEAGKVRAKPSTEGQVLEWSPRGFGFIQIDDGRRAYVHASAFSGDTLLVGETVRCTVIEDAQNSGKWAAIDVERSVNHRWCSTRTPSPADDERFEGTVFEWHDQGGFGFIQIDDGRRAYVHHSAFGGGNLEIGALISFALVPDAQNPGKWSAVDVRLGPKASAGWAAEAGNGFRRATSPMGKGFGLAKLMPQAVFASQPGEHVVVVRNGRVEGIVKEWSDRGYGFIDLHDGRRAYVHVSALGGGDLSQGDTVSAVIVEDEQNPGKWAAKAVRRGPVGEDCTVVEWYEAGGYGFVTMDDDSRRAYIHHSAFGGGNLYVGLRLRVIIENDTRRSGKFRVATVQTELPQWGSMGQQWLQQEECPQHLPQQWQYGQRQRFEWQQEEAMEEGEVAEWDQRGFGFVQLHDGRRAYVHHSAFEGRGDLEVGERVGCVVGPDSRNPGKLAVAHLTRHTVAPAALGAPTEQLLLQEWLPAVIIEWHDDRGYGFVETTDGRKAYVHHSAFGGGSLLQGHACEAVVTPDRRNPGKWSASAVRGDAVAPRPAPAGAEPAAKRQRAWTPELV